MKIYKLILLIGLFLTSVQWIIMSVAMTMLLKAGEQALVVETVSVYYLIMLCVIGCAGFLHLGNKQNESNR